MIYTCIHCGVAMHSLIQFPWPIRHGCPACGHSAFNVTSDEVNMLLYNMWIAASAMQQESHRLNAYYAGYYDGLVVAVKQSNTGNCPVFWAGSMQWSSLMSGIEKGHMLLGEELP